MIEIPEKGTVLLLWRRPDFAGIAVITTLDTSVSELCIVNAGLWIVQKTKTTGCWYRKNGATGGRFRISGVRLLQITTDLLDNWDFTMASVIIALSYATTTLI